MRIRQVKPEFWKDPDVSGLSPFARLTYIGLWMLADDAGWFRYDVPTIALELYGWDPRARREKAVTQALADLKEAGRVKLFGCIHAQIPTLVEHQRFGGETKRVYTYKREHDICPHIPADTRDSPLVPDPVRNGRGIGNGTVSNGTSDARKRDDESETEFRSRVGVPAFMGGKS